jgi:hypothetical protein
MNGNNTYAERQTVINKGEVLFENYCKEKGFKITRVGFDEKYKSVDNFYNLNTMLRNLPDYLVVTESMTFVVMVKGSFNIKEKEVRMIPLFMEWFSSKNAPLVYAFCLENQPPKLIYPEKVIDMYEKSKLDLVWNDGVRYRNILKS